MRTTRAERHSPASYAELSTFIGNLVLDCDDAEDAVAERDRLREGLAEEKRESLRQHRLAEGFRTDYAASNREREELREKLAAAVAERDNLQARLTLAAQGCNAAIARAEKAERERDAYKEEAEDNEADVEAGERACAALETLRAQIAGFQNLDALRQAMVDTADENKSLHARIAQATSPEAVERAVRAYVNCPHRGLRSELKDAIAAALQDLSNDSPA